MHPSPGLEQDFQDDQWTVYSQLEISSGQTPQMPNQMASTVIFVLQVQGNRMMT